MVIVQLITTTKALTDGTTTNSIMLLLHVHVLVVHVVVAIDAIAVVLDVGNGNVLVVGPMEGAIYIVWSCNK